MAIPARIERNLDFLKSLNSTADIFILKNILKEASDDQLLTLVEICHNLLKFRFILSKSQLNILRKFALSIRQISKTRNRVKAEKFLLSQPKKFYSDLLNPLLKKL